MEKYLMRGKNKFLVISFITTLLIYFVYILEFYNVISNVANISTIAFAALSFIISFFFETPIVKSISHENDVILPKNNMANKNIFTGLVDYKSINNTCNFLQRQSHRDNLKSMVKIKQNLKHEINGIFVTGESGAGKSILMQLLANDLRCEYNVIVKQDEYNHFWDIIIDKESDKTIIIFDGFEKSLDYDNLFCDWCEKNKGILKKCVFIFSFPQLYLSRVYNQISNISNDTHLKTYILNLDENDETDYLAKITRLLSVSQEKVTTVWKNMQKGLDVCQDKENYYINLFCKELLKIKRGQSPLIQIEFLAEVANVKEIKDDDFINEYFDHWVSQFENETTAYSILTLFSEYRKYKESDIQLLTFVNSKELIQIKNILSNAPFLHISNALECTFEPKHRYVSEVIRHYISNKEVPNGEKSYIEYYNKYSKKEKYHTCLNERYDLYYKKHKCIDVMLIFMLSGIFMIAMLIPPQDINMCVQRIFTTFVSFPAIFYIYNYSVYILSTEKKFMTFLTYFYGHLSILLSYLFMDSWGAFMGLEIVTLAITIYFSMVRKTDKVAKNKLKRDVIVFGSIGIVVTMLGFIYCAFFSCDTSPANLKINDIYYILKYSYYVLFALYAIMSCFSHIKYPYILGRIGYSNMKEID